MSGAQLVREFRNASNGPRFAARFRNWRTLAVATGVGVCLLAFGAIVVRANDGAGVWEINKQYSPQRQARPAPLPQIFVPSRPVVQTALGYAPLFRSLAPQSAERRPAAAPAAPHRGSPRAIKVVPASKDVDDVAVSSSTSYCVRTCDGFFFPVGNPAASELSAHDAVCERLCPAAETAVFVAPAGSRGIEDAINRKGERYEATRTAFNHRMQFDKACTCTSASQPRNYSVMSDFTLRNGDYVMSTEGLKVFKGEGSGQNRTRDFARADLSKLSAAERKMMEATEAASTRGLAASPSLRARISAQLAATRPQTVAAPKQTVALANQKAKGAAGQDLRYVGPDVNFDRAR